jgi:hypothetical protein
VRPAQAAYPFFKEFVFEHRTELLALMPGARLQTNEVNRLANLLPAFNLAYLRGGHRPLVMVEIGCSAGLNLSWPRYGYIYGDTCVGEIASPVQIHCQLEGVHRPPLLMPLPAVADIVGIELAPPDIMTEQGIRWLEACIWPEEQERYLRLVAAIALARANPPHMLQGEACEFLPDLLAQAPDGQITLWHSFALNQGPAEVAERIEQQISDASRQRAIFRVSLEVDPERATRPILEVLMYWDGQLQDRQILAYCSLHGETMEWVFQSPM